MKGYIQIKNVSKKIKKNVVLDHINLELDQGKIYGFRGINGSGKTMLFRAICGLITPTQGEIIIDNKKLHKEMSFPESIGVLIENPGFLPNYTGKQNLKLLAEIKDMVTGEEIDRIIALVGLDPKDPRKYKQYSLGMKQKLGIAQALMEDPELLLFDEPTNSLDEDSVRNVLDIIAKEKRKGKTILIASHDPLSLEEVSDHIFTIENGSILQERS